MFSSCAPRVSVRLPERSAARNARDGSPRPGVRRPRPWRSVPAGRARRACPAGTRRRRAGGFGGGSGGGEVLLRHGRGGGAGTTTTATTAGCVCPSLGRNPELHRDGSSRAWGGWRGARGTRGRGLRVPRGGLRRGVRPAPPPPPPARRVPRRRHTRWPGVAARGRGGGGAGAGRGAGRDGRERGSARGQPRAPCGSCAGSWKPRRRTSCSPRRLLGEPTPPSLPLCSLCSGTDWSVSGG